MIRMSPHELYETLVYSSDLWHSVMYELLRLDKEMCQDCMIFHIGDGEVYLYTALRCIPTWNFPDASVPDLLDLLEYALDRILGDRGRLNPPGLYL